MNIRPSSSAPPVTPVSAFGINAIAAQGNRPTRSIDASSSPENTLSGTPSGLEDKQIGLGQKPTPAPTPNHELDFAKWVIYRSVTVSPPAASHTPQERLKHIDAYAGRVVTQIENIESGEEGESNIRFQKVRQFLQPGGYFSAGLLAAGYDPHEKMTVTFNAYVGKWKPEVKTNTDKRTYFAWEISAGALKHDRPAAGGLLNFQTMEIEPKDRNKINELESLGARLQDHWKDDIAKPMRHESSALVKRSGKADAYVVRGTLQSLRSDKDAYEKLTPEAREAVERTLEKHGNVVIPNIYGYPMAGYAFIPYINYHGDYDHRPSKGLMIDLKSGTVNEIHGDDDFAGWAKDNRDALQASFNTKDNQGGKNAHWVSPGNVLENLIAGKYATYPGRNGPLTEKAVPVRETFNYAQSRTSAYFLKFGNLDSGIASAYQAMNAKNAQSADQTEVFGSSQQTWKAAKELWGRTFGYVPILGNAGNIYFGVHDAIYGKTADDRVGGTAAAVISGLQVLHEIAPSAVEAGLGEPSIATRSSTTQGYNWKYEEETNGFALVRTPGTSKSTSAALVEDEEGIKVEMPIEAQTANNLTPASDAPFPFPGMREVEFRGKTYFAAETPDAPGAEGYYRLYRLDERYPGKLGSSGIVAKPDEAGLWQKMGAAHGNRLSRMFSPKYKLAREELDTVIAKHKNMSAPVTDTEKEVFTHTLVKLMGESNADDFERVDTYIHADSDFVNRPLRAGHSTPELEEFLHEFKKMNAYEGKAYRSAFVTPEGAARIKEGVGEVFQDLGVQSASATVHNSAEWEEWATGVAKDRGSASQQVVYVFDESIQKKNLSTEFLKDHVAIGPGQPMKILAVKEQGSKLFVYFSAPSEVPEHVYNIFDGGKVY